MPITMADQFKGLPMADLIGGPLQAACDAQVNLAKATANFIQTVGFVQPDPASQNPATDAQVRQVEFKFSRPRAALDGEAAPAPAANAVVYSPMEEVTLQVPLLAIVKIPALAINTVDITFDMEVKNSETTKESEDKKGSFSADASVGWGPFSLKVHVEGSVSTHKENTRETDQSAKYHVEVHAEDKGMPEGLARVLDMMNNAIAPMAIKTLPPGPPQAQPADPNAKLSGPSPQLAARHERDEGGLVVAHVENDPKPRLFREVPTPEAR